jgi:hypothetical protein
VPDATDQLRDIISKTYLDLFGRYGEYDGIEYHVNLWLNGGSGYYENNVTAMVSESGVGNGELGYVNTIGRHTGLESGSCPTSDGGGGDSGGGEPEPEPLPILRPHVNINGSWYRSKDVYIKDAGSWKLCVAGYVKDGGVWKPFIQNAQALTSPGGGGGGGDGGGPTPTTYTIIPVIRYKNNVDDHFCTTSLGNPAPDGYESEGQLCNVFSTQAPGTSPIVDADGGGRPDSGVMGYAYIGSPGPNTIAIYALTNNDTMWSRFTSETPYVYLRTEFYAPTRNLTV